MQTRLFTALATLSLLAGPALAEDARSVWRVFIGDHAAPRITAFDLSAPDRRWSFETAGQAKLYPTAQGAAVVAVQSDEGTVAFLRSGVTLTSHGDHSDIAVEDPSLVAQTLTGARPFHVVSHDGLVTINFDEGGHAAILTQKDVAAGTVAAAKFPQTHAHHGFVAPFGDGMLGTVAAGGEAPRLGLQAFSADGAPKGDLATCTAIHGEAFSGAFLAAGCREGVLTVEDAADGPRFAMLDYPADLPEGKVGTLLGATAMQAFLGNYGADGLVVIDPAEAPHFRHIALPFRRVDFALDPAKPQLAYVLTEDGSLHRVNLLTAAIEDSARVTGPYSMDGHWNDARPRIAVAGDQVLVTDPAGSALHVVAAASLETEDEIAVEGQPFNLTVVGGSGLSH